MNHRSSGLDPRPDKYVVDGNRLYRIGEELLGGPLLQLEMFARVLNAADPDDARVPATLRALISMTRDCSFAPGARLLADGTPLRLTTAQKGVRPVKPRTKPGLAGRALA